MDLCVLLGSQFSLIGEPQANGNRVDSILGEMLPVLSRHVHMTLVITCIQTHFQEVFLH